MCSSDLMTFGTDFARRRSRSVPTHGNYRDNRSRAGSPRATPAVMALGGARRPGNRCADGETLYGSRAARDSHHAQATPMKAMSPEIQQITSHCRPQPGKRGPAQRPQKLANAAIFYFFSISYARPVRSRPWMARLSQHGHPSGCSNSKQTPH